MDSEFLLALYRLAREAAPGAFQRSVAELVWRSCRRIDDGLSPAPGSVGAVRLRTTAASNDRAKASRGLARATGRAPTLDAAWLLFAMPHLVEAWQIHRVIHPKHDAGFRPVTEYLVVVEPRSGAILQAQDGLLDCIGPAWKTFDGLRMPLALRKLWASVDRFHHRSSRLELAGVRVEALVLISAHARSELQWVTPRQLQVASLYAQGWSHKDIATQTRLAPATVRNHIANIFARLSVHSRGELIDAMRTIRRSSRTATR